jgi:mannose/fructose/N-acetylgalactosamine-specific phosphotransferase system component IIC
VPRALWPNKPVVGGSGDIVSQYTGIRFAYGTSVGVGQVLELHVNFGTAGVVLGFIVIGLLVTLVDRRASRYLAEGNISAFGLWYMPGLSLLQVGGSIAEVTATAAASAVLMVVVNKLGQPVAPGAVARVPSRPLSAVDPEGEAVS